MEKLKAFITGANGFLGSHLIDRLLSDGHEVHALVRRSSNITALLGKKITLHYGDVVGDLGELKDSLQGIDVLFHVAGVIVAKKKQTYYDVNTQGTKNVLEACLKSNKNIKRVVVVTSLAAQGPNLDQTPAHEEKICRPITDYGKSKREAEVVTLQYADKLPVTIVRPPAIYGPRDFQFFELFRMIKNGFVLLPGLLGKRSLNACYVQDVVETLILAATVPQAVGEIFYSGDSANYTWGELADTIGQAVSGKNPLKIHLPEVLVYATGFLTELLNQISGKNFPLNIDQAHNGVQKDWTVDVSKARKILGYEPQYSLMKGAKETALWYEKEEWY